MKKICLLVISFIVLQNSFAQITGKIVNEKAAPVADANILLITSKDSSFVKAATTDSSGNFEIQNISDGSYRLHVTVIGYNEYFSAPFKIDNGQQPKNAGTITLKVAPKELQEVTVRAQKPLFQQKPEGLIVNVESSILTKGSSALEVLEQSPGVVINRRDNSIELNGKNGVMVMLNGKLLRMSESQLLDLLNGMSADDIASIELLTSPPAKYDAEGSAGLINIVLKKNKAYGTTASVNLSAGYGYREKATADFNISHNTAKVNMYGSYNFSHNHTCSNMFVDSWQDMPFLGGEIHTLGWDTTHFQQNNHNLNFGTDVKLNSATTIGGSVLYSNNKLSGTTWSHLDYNVLPDSVLKYDGWNSGKSISNNIVSSVYIERKLKNSGKLNLDMDYIYFNRNGPYEVQGSFVNKYGDTAVGNQSLSAPAQRGFAKTNIDVVVGKLDYSTKLNKNMQLEAGMKTSIANSNSHAGFESLTNGVWTSNSQTVSDILMKETISAAYASMNTEINKTTNLVTGLRYEYAATNINDEQTGKQVTHRTLGTFFPNIFVTKKINEKSTLQLSYTKRITRPSYNDLASYVGYGDPTAVYTGNPFLQPTITNNVKLGYNYKSYAFSLQFSHDKNTIARYQLTESPDHDILYISPQNISWENDLTLQAILPFKPFNWWTMNYNLIGGYYKYKITYTKQPFVHGYFNYYLQTTQSFTLPKEYSAELSGSYYNFIYNGTQKVGGILRLNLGLKKELKNNKGSFQLSVTDILRSESYDIHYGTLTQEAFSIKNHVVFYTESTRFPIFKLSYSRTFGNKKTKDSHRINTPAEQDRIQ